MAGHIPVLLAASDHLLVFSPEHPLRFNFLDWENLTGGGHTRNITKCITVIGETLRSGDTTRAKTLTSGRANRNELSTTRWKS